VEKKPVIGIGIFENYDIVVIDVFLIRDYHWYFPVLRIRYPGSGGFLTRIWNRFIPDPGSQTHIF
jgi:hypothetical protein